ncbi:MAG TPA: diguanylate cyclase [Gammaproteobacteria bacterium]|nr:diguanylate cyclase [Gammaproteobacteria bacterium]
MDPEQKSTRIFAETRKHWPVMTFYERFEQVVAIILSFAIAIVVAVALWELVAHIGELLLSGTLDPLDHEGFQKVFGMIMTLLIAMEFKHSIIRVIDRNESIIQVKTVLLIAMLALARKFIVIDTATIGADKLAALAAVILALGAVYWLVRESDQRQQLAQQLRQKQK